MLVRMTSCPYCDGGHNTPCFAEFTDGYKCFTCGQSKSFNLERRGFMGVKAKPKVAKDITLPDYTTNPKEFSLETLKWLAKYHIRESRIKNNIYYCDNSLIFPVLENNEIVFYTRRFFPGKRIINVGQKKVCRFENGHKRVVLVEDYISGVRVSEHCDVWVLFGTSLNYSDLTTLLDKYRDIVIWLDSDLPGRNAAKKIEDNLVKRMIYNQKHFPFKYNCSWNIKLITTEEDPKVYSDTEIEWYLYE